VVAAPSRLASTTESLRRIENVGFAEVLTTLCDPTLLSRNLAFRCEDRVTLM
jgi:hypothetical protein